MKIVPMSGKTSGPVSVMTKTSDSAKPEKHSKNILNIFSSGHNKKESTPTPAAPPSVTSSSTAATNPATENLPTVPSQTTYTNNSAATTSLNNTSSSVTAATTMQEKPSSTRPNPPLTIQTNAPDTTHIFEPVLSAAQKRLYSRLNHGMEVIKHGTLIV